MIGLWALGLWVVVGAVLLWLRGRAGRREYRRRVDRRISTVGQTIQVTVEVAPPVTPPAVADRDLVLVLDHSGSMGAGPGSPLREAIRIVESFVVVLSEIVRVAIVAFDHEARVLAGFGSGSTVRQALTGVVPGGGTAIDVALRRSSEVLAGVRPDVPCTLVLVSDGRGDRDATRAAARHLRDAQPRVTVRCVGVGDRVDDDLMIAIADGAANYLKVDGREDEGGLYEFLLTTVTQSAMAARVTEVISERGNFRLASTLGPHVAGIHVGELTHVVWRLPILTNQPVSMSYGLTALRPGWHVVATAESAATWSMPDAQSNRLTGPDGPRVLVLPRWCKWTWPILNPLFWSIVGRVSPSRATSPVPAESPAEPLPPPTFPEPLPVPSASSYQLHVSAGLVIGLGEVGEWVVCGLKDRLTDRGVGAGNVDVVGIRVGHPTNGPTIAVGLSRLDDTQRIALSQDLRPYLESLRSVGPPATRAWMPWRKWLAEPQPLTTVRGVDDRRKARLALLQQPMEVESRLRPILGRTAAREGVAIVVASADDPEASGLAAEVAHLCASTGLGVTLVLAPLPRRLLPAPEVVATTHELERMLLMRGAPVRSDRGGKESAANRLFDRVVVVQGDGDTAERAASPVVELAFCMLAYDRVLRRLDVEGAHGEAAACWQVDVAAQQVPATALWRWVRERTLATAINGEWLQLEVRDGHFVLPSIAAEIRERDREQFWSGSACQRPRSRLTASLANCSLRQDASILDPLLDLETALPVDQPYHVQAAFAHAERATFIAYLEEWCRTILEPEAKARRWGLPRLFAAVQAVEHDVRSLLDAIAALEANRDLASVAALVAGVCGDFVTAVAAVRGDLAAWIGAFVGANVELDVPAPAGAGHVAAAVERARDEAERALTVPASVDRTRLNRAFEDWYQQYGHMLLEHLQFRIVPDDRGARLDVRLAVFGEELAGDGDVLGTLTRALDPYQNTLQWAPELFLAPTRIASPRDCFRIGKHAGIAYDGVLDVLEDEDPFFVAAIAARRERLSRALGVPGVEDTALSSESPYAWPEEANAVRVVQYMRNSLGREPEHLTPLAVHLLRDSAKLHAALAELACGRVVRRHSEFQLQRGATAFALGPAHADLRGMEAFLEVIRRIVLDGVALDGTQLPDVSEPWIVEPDDAVRAVEASELGCDAATSPSWPMWRDVIRALALVHGRPASAPYACV